MMLSGSTLMLLGGIMWLQVQVRTVRGSRFNGTLVLDNSSCGKPVSHNNQNYQLKMELKLAEDCEGCQDPSCPGNKPGSCSLLFKMDDKFLKTMYELCIDISRFNISSCFSELTIAPVDSYSEAVRMTCGFNLFKKVSCSSSSVKADITYRSLRDLCTAKGYLTVFLQKLSTNTLSYDLTDVQRCQTEKYINIEHDSYQISSWYNSSLGDKPYFCQISALTGSNRDGQYVCLKFQYAYFPHGGAKLVVQKLFRQYYEFERDTLSYSYESHPDLKTEDCMYMTEIAYKDVLLSIKPGDTEGHSTDNKHFDHAFVFTIWIKAKETNWETSWNTDDDDGYSESNEGDSEFQKKVIIAVAVFCVALFVCMYYACSKSKQQNSTQQQPQSELGPEADQMRNPFYEDDPINTGQNDTYTYVYPTSTLIDNPEPTVITFDNREMNDREERDQTEDQFDQPPPEYAHVSPVPSAPAEQREAGAHDQQSTAPTAPPVPPPAYESLFPDQNN